MKQNRLIRYTIWGILIICPWILTSCDMFHEDLPECRLFVKFKYDYNMLIRRWIKWSFMYLTKTESFCSVK